MFEELYAKIEQYLIDNEISKPSEIKQYCDDKIKELFKGILPGYLNKFNEMQYLINACAASVANTYKIDVNDAYDKLTGELDLIIPDWMQYIDINNLANAISDVFVDRYYKSKYSDENFGKSVNSFKEVVINTININVESGYKISSKEDLEDFLRTLFHKYFDEKQVSVFTAKNKSRDYVIKKGKHEILKEMMKSSNIDGSLPLSSMEDIIRESYIRLFVETSSLNNEKNGNKK